MYTINKIENLPIYENMKDTLIKLRDNVLLPLRKQTEEYKKLLQEELERAKARQQDQHD